jgi:hypothetical protein
MPLLTMPLKSSGAEEPFSVSGVIVDKQSQKGLPGVSVHLVRLLRPPQKGFEIVKREIAVTGSDGGFKAVFPELKASELPLTLELTHPDWGATHIGRQIPMMGDHALGNILVDDTTLKALKVAPTVEIFVAEPPVIRSGDKTSIRWKVINARRVLVAGRYTNASGTVSETLTKTAILRLEASSGFKVSSNRSLLTSFRLRFTRETFKACVLCEAPTRPDPHGGRIDSAGPYRVDSGVVIHAGHKKLAAGKYSLKVDFLGPGEKGWEYAFSMDRNGNFQPPKSELDPAKADFPAPPAQINISTFDFAGRTVALETGLFAWSCSKFSRTKRLASEKRRHPIRSFRSLDSLPPSPPSPQLADGIGQVAPGRLLIFLGEMVGGIDSRAIEEAPQDLRPLEIEKNVRHEAVLLSNLRLIFRKSFGVLSQDTKVHIHHQRRVRARS